MAQNAPLEPAQEHNHKWYLHHALIQPGIPEIVALILPFHDRLILKHGEFFLVMGAIISDTLRDESLSTDPNRCNNEAAGADLGEEARDQQRREKETEHAHDAEDHHTRV